ncbi:DUF4136 domain-containing protein [Chitinophaga japonensis]|uniref:Uncharacterized protein DUF4136 n=1 Tax=Chitinophaga japonensis TaxID=104662 RepID=A0A562TBH5_CHIJA|nr:DUF4136 domain-containing protein [Chitinophaga japonensis]TWI90919.1 uncharacterized protein DUF4136 [Chitinophaga japonensis]
MKKMTITGLVLGMFIAAIGCGPSSTRAIGENVDPDVTKLEDAKTYGWITDIDNIPDARAFISPTGIYVFNNESARERIKDAIAYELSARGYEKQEATGGEPGIEVSFLVLEQADTLRRTGDYVTVQGDAVIPEDNVEQVPVMPGTLIINLTDGKTDKMVWQGFASGIIKPEDVNDKSKIRQAVSSIFSQFNPDAISGG